MGNEVSLPPIGNDLTPSVSMAVSLILTELNSAFTSSIQPHYLLPFITQLKDSLSEISDNVDLLLDNAPSPQSQLTAIQGQIATLQSTLATLQTSTTSATSNLSTSVNTLTTQLSNISSNISSINLTNLSTTLSALTNQVNNLTADLSNKVSTSRTINMKPLTTNIVLTTGDIGLGNVDNTSDLNKPLSTAAVSALAGKINKNTPIISGTVGSSNSIPVLNYDSNGLILTANSVSAMLTPNQVGLSNVQNVNTTLASNVLIDQPLTSQSNAVVQGDTVLSAVSKLQSRANNKIDKIGSGYTGVIPLLDNVGGVISSSKVFNDLGNTSNDILSALAVKNLVNSSLTGVLSYRGSHSGPTYPTTGGSGASGAILKGDLWYVSSAFTLGATTLQPGDALISNTDNPGTTASNWDIIGGAMSFTPEDVSNKNNTTMTSSSVEYPTTGLVQSYVTGLINTREPSVTAGTASQYWKGDKSWATLDATAVGLSNVTNNAQLTRGPSDINSFPSKTAPVITDVMLIEDSQNAYAKAKISLDRLPITTNLANQLTTFVPKTTTVNGLSLSGNITITPALLGLDQVNNTPDLSKPVSAATTTALSTKVDKINLPNSVTVGSSSGIPQITYNTQGQVVSSSEVPIIMTKAQVGLSNVPNVDCTNLAVPTIVGTFLPSTTPIVTGDSGTVVAQKAQGQLNMKADKLVSPVLGAILVSDASGNVSNSMKLFNDSGNGLNHIISAAEINSRIAATTGTSSVRIIGMFTPVVAATYPLTTASNGQAWIIAAAGSVGTNQVYQGDVVIALADNPGNTATNWAIVSKGLGYVAENSSLKESVLTPTSTTNYPSSKAVSDYLAATVGTLSVLPPGGTTAQYLRGDSTWQTLDKSAVGLSNVSNGAQVLRSTDYATYPTITTTSNADLIMLEDSANLSAKSVITVANLKSSLQPSLTANRTVVTSSTGTLAASATTDTEIGYCSGVTGPIQTQLNNKLDSTVAVLNSTTTPAAPSSGLTKLYTKSNGSVYKMGADGIETELGGGAVTLSGVVDGFVTRSVSGAIQNSGVVLSTDSTFTAMSDTIIPSQKAIADYVVATSLSPSKEAVRVLSDSNVSVTGSGVLTTTANGALVIDGVTLTTGNSVLLNGQTTSSQNGIYVVTSIGTASTPTVLTRRSDSNSEAEMKLGSIVAIAEGTVYTGTLFYQSSVVTTLETSAVQYLMINVGYGNLRVTNNLSELSSTSSTARSNIGAAASGINTDINSVNLNYNGLGIKCQTGSNNLTVSNGGVYTANRVLTIDTNDQSTTLTLPTTSASIAGVNTGDETSATITTKVGLASTTNTGLLSSTDWNTFNDKVPSTRTVAGQALSSDITLTASSVGLGNVNNTSDLNKPISTAVSTALSGKENTSNKGVANGYAGLNSSGVVPTTQLPTFSLSMLSDVLFV